MREVHGLKGRVSNKLKVTLLALVAVFAISGLSASQATAAQQVKLSFNDGWIGVPALSILGAGSMQALDPTDGKDITVDLTGSLAADGTFNSPKSAFKFPAQHFDEMGGIDLKIVAVDDITGKYDSATGAFSATLALSLRVEMATTGCEISPLVIPLKTEGTQDFGTPTEPNEKAGEPFAAGTGAVLGSWTGVTVNSVVGIPNDATTTDGCRALIGGLIGEDDDPNTPPASFDGSIWLGGTATVTGEPDKPDPEVKPGKVGKITAAKKGKVKKGKATTIKVKVKNVGGKVLKGKLAIKSSNKQVKAPKSAKLNVKPGKTQTIKVKVKASKKAKGKAKITFTAGGKKAVTTLAVKK